MRIETNSAIAIAVAGLLLLNGCGSDGSLKGEYSTSGSRDEMTQSMIKIATEVCVSKLASNEKFKNDTMALNLNMIPREICSCSYKKLFGELTDAEFDRMLNDAERYGDQLHKREPWKKRILKATLSCIASGIKATSALIQ